MSSEEVPKEKQVAALKDTLVGLVEKKLITAEEIKLLTSLDDAEAEKLIGSLPREANPTEGSNADSAKEKLFDVELWGKRIKESGAALVSGKLHPDWFSEKTSEVKVTPLENEPGFSDGGHINASPKNLIHARSPLSGLPGNTFERGDISYNKGRFQKDTDQLLFMSPVRPPSDEYNKKMLDGRFKEEWREVSWSTHVKENNDVPFRTPTNTFSLRIFLPDKMATELFGNMKDNPTLFKKLMEHLYPNVPYGFEDKKRLFVKELTDDELKMPYARPVQEGGEFINLEQRTIFN